MNERATASACVRLRAAGGVRWFLLLAIAVLTTSTAALADGRVQFLSERLKYPPAAGQTDDFRVRTNAALALGATNDDAAVAPLCAALSDPSDVVRQAVAVALKRLGRATARDCLKARLSVESSAAVKQEVQRAIDAVGTGPAAGGSTGKAARFYVSLSRVVNHTTRSSEEVEQIVHDAIASKLSDVGGYRIAPAGESADAARAEMTKGKMKGYYLSVSVDKFEYTDDGLRVRVKIAVFSYPGKDLRGEVPAGATLPGARPNDRGSEDQLMTVVAARAAELFTQNFQ